ncbi:MAG: hypothetical protein J0L57_04175 [Burkholderiales bacterium]|nr:hypothetical protein [Burkholderiales bacterium]
MPYFVYAVRPFAQLERLGEFPAFKDASAFAKAERAARSGEAGTQVRVMFAADQTAAEDLLLQVRDRAPEPDD